MLDPNILATRLLQRAHNRDGLPELAAGTILLLAAGLIYAQAVLPRATFGFRAAVLAFAFGLPLFTIGARPLFNWVRSRFFLERYGYVRPRPQPRTLRAFLLPGLAAVAVIAVAAFAFPPPGTRLVAFTGVAGGLLLALAGRLPRFLIGGTITAAAGIWLAFSGLTLAAGMAALFAIQGAGSVLSGAVTL
jgi:hypothetical protein